MSVSVPARKADWLALFLGLLLALNAIGLLAVSAFLLVLAASAGRLDESMLLMPMLFAAGAFFCALLLIPGIYLNGRKFFGLPELRISMPPVNEATLFALLATCWMLSLVSGQFISSGPLAFILLPVLNILAIGLPVLFFLRMALRKLELPPAQYGWSAFGVTLALGPLAGILLEVVAFAIIIFILGIYATFHRELAEQLAHLAHVAQTSKDPDTLIITAAPIMLTPPGLLAILGIFSLAVPAIEEAVKIAVLWLFAGRLRQPVHGFVLGVVCGAGFALAESLGFSSTAADSWVGTAAVRASSALPHMLNSGILGWALVSAWKHHSYLRLGMAYLAVMSIHGIWNAISLALGVSSLLPYVQQAPALIKDPIPFLSGWGVMILGTFVGLIYCNRVLRFHAPSRVGYNEPPSLIETGETHGHSEDTA